MTEEEFGIYVNALADVANAINEAGGHDAGPTVLARYSPDEDGFSRIEIGLRWLGRTPLDELEGEELAAETIRRSASCSGRSQDAE